MHPHWTAKLVDEAIISTTWHSVDSGHSALFCSLAKQDKIRKMMRYFTCREHSGSMGRYKTK